MHYLFTIEISDPEYSVDRYAEAWVAASRIIQRAPGARGTRLHRKIGDPRTLLAIASWDSKAARDAMESDPPAEVTRIIQSQIPHVSITLIGEFDAPDWEVLPPGQSPTRVPPEPH